MPVPAIIWKLICISTLSTRNGAIKISANQDSLYAGPNKNVATLTQSIMKSALAQNIRIIIVFENILWMVRIFCICLRECISEITGNIKFKIGLRNKKGIPIRDM
jgi:hypothetical protein